MSTSAADGGATREHARTQASCSMCMHAAHACTHRPRAVWDAAGLSGGLTFLVVVGVLLAVGALGLLLRSMLRRPDHQGHHAARGMSEVYAPSRPFA